MSIINKNNLGIKTINKKKKASVIIYTDFLFNLFRLLFQHIIERKLKNFIFLKTEK